MSSAVVPLDRDEDVLWSGRPRLATVLPEVVAGTVLIVAAVAVAVQIDEPRVAIVAVAGIALPVWKYLVVTNTAYVVTDRALYRKTGVLSRDVRRIGLERVQNSSSRQGIRGVLLRYGTVVVEAAGGGQIRFHAIMEPRAVRSLVDNRVDAIDVPGSIDQWEAILAEVRAFRRAVGES